ncbi:MAG: class II aldolase/adducin family protein [Chloroflexi bacterium]|nr:class II aldolase/adducin family protein [Chloroflexota bacterium]
MAEDFSAERTQVLEAVRRIVDLGLVAGAAGNVSMRLDRREHERFAVTASRVPYHRFTLDDVLIVDADIEPVFGDGIPSSESLAHLAVYRARPDVRAVIHTHSPQASAFACAARDLPVILDEQVLALGGAVQCAEYGASASDDLADHAVAALADRAAVLLRNHGVLGVGADLEEAVAVVELVERVAAIYIAAAALGSAKELSPDIVSAQQRIYRMLKGHST